MICLKNIGLYSIAGLAYYFIGYNLMYGDIIGGLGIGGLIGFMSRCLSADEVGPPRHRGDAEAAMPPPPRSWP